MEIQVAGRTVRAATGGRSLEPDRPLLVLLHGAGMDHTAWALVMRALSHGGYSVLAPDLPGHGPSEGPVPSSVEAYADWTAELIGAAGFPAAHVAGHSMGAAIGLQLAASRPDLVRSLALLGTAATMPVHPDLILAADAGDGRAAELIMSWGLAPDSQLGRHPTPGMTLRGAGIRLLDRVGSEALASDLRASAAYTNALAAAATVRCRTLLILGDLDMMTPARNAAPLVDALADPAVVRLAGTGHMMMLERPDAVIDTLLEFIAAS